MRIDYPFKTQPYQHQLDCWLRSRGKDVFAFLAEMGTGKSKMLIDTIAWLYDQGSITGALIVAPKGVYRNWYDLELPTHMPAHVRWRAACWSAEARKEDRDALAKLGERGDDLRVLLMNVEALSTKRGVEHALAFLSSTNSLFAIDEATAIKNPAAMRTKAILRLARYSRYRRIMSGDLAANSPLNVYAPFVFLDPHLLGFGSFWSFKTYFCHLVTKQLGNRQFKHVAGYQNLDELYKIIAPHSFIVKKADCLDLPPKVYQRRVVELGAKQKRAYESMRERAVVFLSELEKKKWEGLRQLTSEDNLSFDDLARASVVDQAPPASPEGAQMSTSIVITQILRLHQIACGFMTTDDGVTIDFDEPNDRLETLLEVLEECGTKAIVWATYRRNVKQITEAVAERFGRESVVQYYGDTSQDDRRAAVRLFQDPASPVRFFVGNPQTAGFGLTLTEAGTVVYYSNSYDLEHRNQSEDRAHRIGQKKSVTYVDLVAERTIDEKIIKSLREKRSVADLVTRSNWRSLF